MRLRKTLHPMLTLIVSVTIGFLLAYIHITKARVVSNKVRRGYTTLCMTQYKCHRFLPHVSNERCSCDVTWNCSIVTWQQGIWLIYMHNSRGHCVAPKGECGYIIKTLSMCMLQHLCNMFSSCVQHCSWLPSHSNIVSRVLLGKMLNPKIHCKFKNTITAVIFTFQSFWWLTLLLLRVNSVGMVEIFWPTTSMVHQLCSIIWVVDLRCESVTFNSYTMGTSGLPEIYTRSPRAVGPRAEGIYIRRATSAHGITTI